MTIVTDASTVVAGLIGTGAVGSWARKGMASHRLVASHLVRVEAANVLRRLALAGQITREAAAQAHQDLLSRPVQLVPYAPFADRVLALVPQLTCYDAWHVAVEERLQAPLATLARRLAQSPAANCVFELPPLPEPPGP